KQNRHHTACDGDECTATNTAMCSPHPLHPADRSVGGERLQNLLAVLGGVDLVVLQQDLAVRSDNKSPALRRDVSDQRFLLAVDLSKDRLLAETVGHAEQVGDLALGVGQQREVQVVSF